MQELEQRAAWDGKIFVDGGFRAPEGGETLTVLDKAAQEPIGGVGVASRPISTPPSAPRRPRSRPGPPSPTTSARASSAPRPPRCRRAPTRSRR